MAIKMPERYELVGLFECEPTPAGEIELLQFEAGHLHFDTQRNQDHIVCDIHVCCDRVHFTWYHQRKRMAYLEFREVRELQIEMQQGHEGMYVFPRSEEATYWLQFRPHVQIERIIPVIPTEEQH